MQQSNIQKEKRPQRNGELSNVFHEEHLKSTDETVSLRRFKSNFHLFKKTFEYLKNK